MMPKPGFFIVEKLACRKQGDLEGNQQDKKTE